MKSSVFDLTLKIQSHKTLITTTQVNYFVETSVVKLRVVEAGDFFK